MNTATTLAAVALLALLAAPAVVAASIPQPPSDLPVGTPDVVGSGSPEPSCILDHGHANPQGEANANEHACK